ncbi:phosphoglycerate mutase [Alcanivorax xiamenensis]|uniref:Phosphoglycerate mutase n=1 Tax=Alcanivorax xiamenensis TaxID=1177156 RepID=A0ABQ6YC22_9GAMM|nr:histidine phosphatase family protein [Alcanivorax xiamenensis]KAF0807647.1 phosphoglycerate mutase [Alcanivorax xiamenensis]
MGRIFLVRHGQASLLGGDYDQLSELGMAQAGETGLAFLRRGILPDIIVSGSLKRQSETARCAAAAAQWTTPLEQDDHFDEYRHEDMFAPVFPEFQDHAALAQYVSKQERPRREFQRLFEQAFEAWLAGHERVQGRRWEDFRVRALEATVRVAERLYTGQSAMVVTSGGVIAAITQALLDLPDEHVLRLHNPIYNASVTRLVSKREKLFFSGFNDVAHLEVLGRDWVTYR